MSISSLATHSPLKKLSGVHVWMCGFIMMFKAKWFLGGKCSDWWIDYLWVSITHIQTLLVFNMGIQDNLERESRNLSEVTTGFFPGASSCVLTCVHNIKGNQGNNVSNMCRQHSFCCLYTLHTLKPICF